MSVDIKQGVRIPGGQIPVILSEESKILKMQVPVKNMFRRTY